MIDELLREADIQTKDLDAIAFGQGPGAFTGVRIAVGVIQGLAFAHDTPVIPVSSLNALAQHYARRALPRCSSHRCTHAGDLLGAFQEK